LEPAWRGVVEKIRGMSAKVKGMDGLGEGLGIAVEVKMCLGNWMAELFW